MPGRTAFSYCGGKSRAIHVLEHVLTTYFPKAKTLYSPFMGGGSFEIYCANELDMDVHANDLFVPVYKFWNALKNHRNDLEREILELTPISKADYHEFLPIMNVTECKGLFPTTTLQGALFYVLINASFSGALGNYSPNNVKKKCKEAIVKRLNAIDLRRITITNLDVIDFLKANPRAGMTQSSVIYLDPPYIVSHKLYGVNGNLHKQFNHQTLRDAIVKRKYWFLCYNDCKLIRDLYRGYHFMPAKWAHTFIVNTGTHNHKATPSKEIIILSLHIGAQHKSKTRL
jgi:DNA adenine methylase